MATTTLTLNPQLITAPDATENDINFSNILKTQYGIAHIERVSGTTVQINANGVAISGASPAIVAANPIMEVPIRTGQNIRFKGGAGAETFLIIITPLPNGYIN